MDESFKAAGHVLELLRVQDGLPNMMFFHEINSFLDDEISEFAGNLLGRTLAVAGAAVLSLMTLWILVQGYRIATGQSREPMMALVASTLRAVLVIGIATGAAGGSGSIYHALTNGLTDVVQEVMTGDDDGGTYEDIDRTLAILQVALEVIDSVDVGDDLVTAEKKDRALWFAGVGLGGPAVMAATMLLLNKVAIALIVGLGPLFILCLLFPVTSQLFQKWLFYGIGTLFSLALLSVMVTLALDMVIAVGLAFWMTSWIPGGGSEESLTAMAMQQGGLGLILTMLIVSAPPMAAVFFQGVMGQFTPYSAFSRDASAVVPPGQPGAGTPLGPATVSGSNPAAVDQAQAVFGVREAMPPAAVEPGSGRRGAASPG
jgi:type IV secretion system protein VirB6